MFITDETYKKVGLIIGILAGLSSLIGIISILFFSSNYSYMAIGLGIFSCFTLLKIYFKKF
ncbi:hypothetical protein [Senegalia massiliensis]|uniref:hypothetical protein n=1 Tax=Senegalia massiliensis TaxID=1720316 RepID=UPI00102FFFA6|nr:hypothetical protein [Senegalia massiliensis]